jgi:cobalt/nickel transport system permease protein
MGELNVHVPDGFLDLPTSAATGAVAVLGVGLTLRKARHELDDRTAPMAGLVAAVIFALQMMNFPVAGGTSGHLLGGVLAAVLVGPATGVLCVSVVLIVQSLLLADGGVSALGTNITLMALVGSLVVQLAMALRPAKSTLVAAVTLGAFVSVPAAAAVFALIFAVGGVAPVATSTLLTAMVGWHLLIGCGEAAITGLIVASVVAVRPDLVFAARSLPKPELVLTPGRLA